MDVEVSALQPAREYWYRFHVGQEVSQIGRAVTAPAAGAAVNRLRFAVCGCSHYETGFFTAYRHLAAEHFDFVFHTGDYIYEGRGNRARNPNLVREHHGQEIYTLVDYRNRYAQYKSDPDLRAAHAAAPFIVSWDDHEVDNDYAGYRRDGLAPRRHFCCGGPPRIRPTASTCRSESRVCRRVRTFSSTGTWSSAIWSTSACSIRVSTAPTKHAGMEARTT